MKILYILSTYNIFGGTPKKTLDLIKHSSNDSFLYVYENKFKEFKYLFDEASPYVFEGFYGRNLYKHIKKLLEIIDKYEIQIIQTQFTFGEILGGILKTFRPHVKLIIAFVAPFNPTYFKSLALSIIYKKADAFVYISGYVKKEKEKYFPVLLRKKSKIIFNGTEKRIPNGDECVKMNHPALYTTSGLTDWKNIDVLIESLKVIINRNKSIYLYVSGDGPERKKLENKIKEYQLEKRAFLLGYQKNIGGLLQQADIYVHPAYAEGFGIAVAEAMMAEKPVIVADAGALPELVENNKSGLVVNPYDSNEWVDAIIKLLDDKPLAEKFAKEARKRAEENFSVKKYVENYENLYKELLE